MLRSTAIQQSTQGSMVLDEGENLAQRLLKPTSRRTGKSSSSQCIDTGSVWSPTDDETQPEKILREGNRWMDMNDLMRAVARVCVGRDAAGTGFCISYQGMTCLMTCHHVIYTPDTANQAKVEFWFIPRRDESQPACCGLDPGKLFKTSKDLDLTIVALQVHDRFEPFTLSIREAPPSEKETISVYGYPGGRRSLVQSTDEVREVNEKLIWYMANTDPGHSGGAVLDRRFDIVAIHRGGGIKSKSHWNGGIKALLWKELFDGSLELVRKDTEMVEKIQSMDPGPDPVLDLRDQGIGDGAVKVLAGRLHSYTSLKTLDLRHNNIGSSGAQALAGALKGCPTLEVLHLTHNNIGDEGALWLLAALHSCKLKCLYVGHNDIHNVSALRVLFKEPCKTLQTLDWGSTDQNCLSRRANANTIGVEAAAVLADVVLPHLPALDTLNLSSTNIEKEEFLKVAAALPKCTALHTLDLSGNRLGGEVAKTLAGALSKCTALQTLNLSNTSIGEEGAIALGGMLSRNILALDLGSNDITDSGAKALASALGEMDSRMVTLILRSNDIGDDGAVPLVRVLPASLMTLDLGNNKIGDKGAAELAKWLPLCFDVRTLILERNNIGDDGATRLAQVLPSALQTLSLESNNIRDAGASELAKALALPRCPALQTLTLGLNSIGTTGARKLAEALQSCWKLETLDFWSNQNEEIDPSFSMTIPINNLALIYRNKGKVDEAKELYERVLAFREQVPKYPPDIKSSRRALADLLKVGDVLPVYEQAREIEALDGRRRGSVALAPKTSGITMAPGNEANAPADSHIKRKAEKLPSHGPVAKTSIAPGEGQAATPPLTSLFKTTKIYLRGDKQYHLYQYQYGSSSHVQEGYMAPAAIIYPQYEIDPDYDVKAAIRYARENELAIAVRTGGHQYSGASSTYGDNIQLDLSEAYMDSNYDETAGLVHVGVSFELTILNKYLGKHGLFVPTGQCSHVHVGGHAQSGGYGQLARAFGLFGDHIMRIRIITADEVVREIQRGAGSQEDRDLFYGVLGGSPGNYGVLTHIWFKPHKDTDHPNSRGLKAFTLYNKTILSQLLEVLSELSDDHDAPGDIDYCVTVMSQTLPFLQWFHFGLDMGQLIQSLRAPKFRPLYGTDENLLGWPAFIMVYLQWSNLGGPTQVFDPTWFDKVKDALSLGGVQRYLPLRVNDDVHTPISKLTSEWIFTNVREYNLPYEKRVYVTRSTTLTKDHFAEIVTKRIDELQSDRSSGCKVVVQIQPFGGKYSAHRNLANEETAFSFRDATVGCTLDAFYDEADRRARLVHRSPKEEAIRWQEENDELLKGPDGCLSKGQDLRWLWGSYGDINMDNVWRVYHEDQAKYDRLIAIKNRFDPHNVFTPNPFCVGAIPYRRNAPSVPEDAQISSAAEATVVEEVRMRFDLKNDQMLKMALGVAEDAQFFSMSPAAEAEVVKALRLRRDQKNDQMLRMALS